MREIWVGIHPRSTETRILATAGPAETLLKARLAATPGHPRALASLLEGLPLWQGTKIRAALSADPRDGTSGTSCFRDSLLEPTGPLYSLEVVEPRRRRQHDGLDGMGDFRDLRQLVLLGVAR